MTVSIFLSYARGDEEPFVRRLFEGPQKAGFKVWFDRVSMLSFAKTLRGHKSRTMLQASLLIHLKPILDHGKGEQ